MDPKPTNIPAFLAGEKAKLEEARRKFEAEQNRQTEAGGAEIRSFAERTHSKTKELARIKKQLAETMQAYTDIKEWETRNQETPDTKKLKEELQRASQEQAVAENRLWAEIEQDKKHKHHNASSPVKPELMDKIRQAEFEKNSELTADVMVIAEDLVADHSRAATWENILATAWAEKNDLAAQTKKKNALQLKGLIATEVSAKIKSLESEKLATSYSIKTLPQLLFQEMLADFPYSAITNLRLQNGKIEVSLVDWPNTLEAMNSHIAEIAEELRELQKKAVAWEKAAATSNSFTRAINKDKQLAYERSARELLKTCKDVTLAHKHLSAASLGHLQQLFPSLSVAVVDQKTAKIKTVVNEMVFTLSEHRRKLGAVRDELEIQVAPFAKIHSEQTKKIVDDTKRWSNLLRSLNENRHW